MRKPKQTLSINNAKISTYATGTSVDYQRFEQLTRDLLSVSKEETAEQDQR